MLHTAKIRTEETEKSSHTLGGEVSIELIIKVDSVRFYYMKKGETMGESVSHHPMCALYTQRQHVSL